MTNPCKSCTHYENCFGAAICNSYVSREDMHMSESEQAASRREYNEYREQYYSYAAEDRD